MKKIIIVLITIIVILMGVFFYIFFQAKNDFNREDVKFYQAIDLLKDGKYTEAYQLIDKIDNIENQKIISNIIAYSYWKKIYDCLEDINQVSDDVDDIVQEASISASIYGRIEVSSDKQKEINVSNKKIIEKYNSLNKTYPKEILYTDLENLYNSFDEVITSYDGLCDNLKEKLSSDKKRNQLAEDMKNFVTKLEKLSKYIEDVKDLHPLKEIPERYRIMFEFDKKG